MQEGQLAGALQYRIEHPDEPGETSVLIFGLNPNPQITAMGQEIRSLLRLRPELKEIRVFSGGYAGKDDEIDLATRSMLHAAVRSKIDGVDAPLRHRCAKVVSLIIT